MSKVLAIIQNHIKGMQGHHLNNSAFSIMQSIIWNPTQMNIGNKIFKKAAIIIYLVLLVIIFYFVHSHVKFQLFIVGIFYESSHPDLMLKYLLGGGYLPGNCLSVRWYPKKASWKIVICSVAKKVFLENRYLFGSQKRSAPGK